MVDTTSGLPVTTNALLTPPSFLMQVSPGRFWDNNITNEKLVRMYRRKGVAFRVINKETNLLFKNLFTSDNDEALRVRDSLEFTKYAQYAVKNAMVSGWSLIYKNYGDVQTENDYAKPASPNAIALDFYCVTRAWVHEDIYINQEVRDYYRIYRADGSSFRVHKSRFIRVQANEDEISRLEPAYDSIEVLDNVLWGIGQTMFRSGSGFPVLKVSEGTKVVNAGGANKTKIQLYKDSGILTDMNSMTGFLIDAADDLSFAGAQGKAITPGEYYDRAFQQCAVDLEIPVDILKGVSAGAVTGSETNLKEYYGDLASKQQQVLTPVYQAMYEAVGYAVDVDFKYPPIFEQSPEQINAQLQRDVETIYKLEQYGYFDHAQAVEYFSRNYKVLDYDDAEVAKLSTLPTYAQPSPVSTPNILSSDSASLSGEVSALPVASQAVSDKYEKTMQQAFRKSSQHITSLLQAFNTE
jgi:hypothetical protein